MVNNYAVRNLFDYQIYPPGYFEMAKARGRPFRYESLIQADGAADIIFIPNGVPNGNVIHVTGMHGVCDLAAAQGQLNFCDHATTYTQANLNMQYVCLANWASNGWSKYDVPVVFKSGIVCDGDAFAAMWMRVSFEGYISDI